MVLCPSLLVKILHSRQSGPWKHRRLNLQSTRMRGVVRACVRWGTTAPRFAQLWLLAPVLASVDDEFRASSW